MKKYKDLPFEEKVLSADHTFKIAKSVKILTDQSKVAVWGALLTVFWKGQLLIAQFLIDSTIEKTKKIFRFIQDELGGINILLTDNCCENSGLTEICIGMKNRKDLAHLTDFLSRTLPGPQAYRDVAFRQMVLNKFKNCLYNEDQHGKAPKKSKTISYGNRQKIVNNLSDWRK